MKVTVVLTPSGFSVIFFFALLSLQPVLGDLPSGGGLQHCLPPDAFETKFGPIGVESVSEPNGNPSDNSQLFPLMRVLQHLIEPFEPGTEYFTEVFRKTKSTLVTLSSYIAIIMYCIVELPNSIATMVTSLTSYFPGDLTVLVLPLLYGFSMVMFSWMLIYYDSKVPGVYPPSPISPKKIRENSGHTFHLGYTVGLVNGFIVFALSLWSQMSQ